MRVLLHGKLAYQQKPWALVYRGQIKVHAPLQGACSSSDPSMHLLAGKSSNSLLQELEGLIPKEQATHGLR